MKVTMESKISGESNTLDLPITQDQIDRWIAGELIQDVMPELSASDREFLISGSTDKEWDDAFPEDTVTTVENSLKNRYEIYVDCMIAIKKPHKNFNEWLGV
jgi:hypothetical protein|tara:strand:- start:1241 stop:1546 length:306 start_codon:yes stop_codon:yes gene_type:complete